MPVSENTTVLKSGLLDALPWLVHGFGTRDAEIDQSRMASLKQIHSGAALLADRAAGECGEADALVTAEAGVTVSIRTADCVPILLADPETRAVAAVHAGWRGTAARISESALGRMRGTFGARPEIIIAAIGPAIGRCCYEVSAEVGRALGADFDGALHGYVDLREINRRQLVELGVAPERIELVGGCTKCHPEQFFSWRGEGERAGRMVSFIGRK